VEFFLTLVTTDKGVADKVSRTVSTNRRVHTDDEHYILKTQTANSWLLQVTAKNKTVNTEREFFVCSFIVNNKVQEE
jgi:hypothetical protein